MDENPSAGRRSMSRSMRLSHHENQRLPWKLHLSASSFLPPPIKHFKRTYFLPFYAFGVLSSLFSLSYFSHLSLCLICSFSFLIIKLCHISKPQTKSKIHKNVKSVKYYKYITIKISKQINKRIQNSWRKNVKTRFYIYIYIYTHIYIYI